MAILQQDIYMFSISSKLNIELNIPLLTDDELKENNFIAAIQVEIKYDQNKFEPILQIAPSEQRGITVFTSKGKLYHPKEPKTSYSKNKHNSPNHVCYYCFKIAKGTQLPIGMDIVQLNEKNKSLLYFKQPTTIDINSFRSDSFGYQLSLSFQTLNNLWKSDGYGYIQMVEWGYDVNANFTKKMVSTLSTKDLNLEYDIQLQLIKLLNKIKKLDFPDFETMDTKLKRDTVFYIKNHLLGKSRNAKFNFHPYFIDRLNEYVQRIEKSLEN